MRITLIVLLSIFISLRLSTQTNPPSQTIPYTQNFGTTTYTTLPAGWISWNGLNGASITSQSLAEASSPIGNATLSAATAANTTGGTYGYMVSTNARPYIQTSANATNGVNQLALAVNTTGHSGIIVAYDVEIISAQPRTVGIVLQYRVGTTGSWTTVAGAGNPYSQAGGTIGIKANVSVKLPAAADNNAVVQLRWATWRGNEAGNSSGIAIDNVVVRPLSNTSTSGIFDGYSVVNNTYYDLITATLNPDFNGANLGTFPTIGTMSMNGGEIKTYKNTNDNICGGKIWYNVFPAASAPGSFSTINLSFIENLPVPPNNYGDQKWGSISGTSNLITGLSQGLYKLAVYVDASGHNTTSGCAFDPFKLQNNNGNYWIANFTVCNPYSVSISSSDTDNSFCAGTSVTFTAAPTNGGSTPSYQWKVNGSNVGTNSPSFTSTTLANGDVVTVQMISSESCTGGVAVSSNAITITVLPNLPVSVSITSSDLDNSICLGTSVTFTASTTNGGSSPSYQWKLNGSNVGTNAPIYTTATLTHNDNVSVVLTSNGICITSNPATSNSITTMVNSLTGTPSFISGATSLCQDAPNETYTAIAVNATGISYSLSPLSAGTINATTGVVNWDENFSGAATVTATATGLCGTTMSSVIVGLALPPQVNGDAITKCSGDKWLASLPAMSTNSTIVSSLTITSLVYNATYLTRVASHVPSSLPASGLAAAITQEDIWTNSHTVAHDVIYRLVPVGNGCSGDTVNFTAYIEPAPSAEILFSNGNICEGSIAKFRIGGAIGHTVGYKINGGSTQSGTLYDDGDGNGIYDVTVTGVTVNQLLELTYVTNHICTLAITSQKDTVVVNPPFTAASLTGSGSICQGGSQPLSLTFAGGTPPFTAQIYDEVGDSLITLSGITSPHDILVSPTVTSGYALVVLYGLGCQLDFFNADDSVTVTLLPNLPVSVSIVSNDADNEICDGTLVTFTATAVNGGSMPAYQWIQNGSPIVGENGDTFITDALADGDAITVELLSDALCPTYNPDTSNVIALSVISNEWVSVSITSSDSDNNICEGTSVTFTAAPSNGGSMPSYQWKRNGIDVGTNSNTYTTTDLVNGDAVQVLLTSNLNCSANNPSTSNTITTSVLSNLVPSVAISSNDSDNTVCAGGPIVFTASPTNGGTMPTYQWKKNGTNISGEVSSSLTTSNLINGDLISVALTSNYTCVVGVNSASSNSLAISINPLPTVGINQVQSCGGANATLTASGGLSYIWDNMSTDNPRSVVADGTYTVTVTDANGCTDTDSEIVSGLGMPPVNIGGICYTNIMDAVNDATGNMMVDTIHVNFGIYNPSMNVSLELGDVLVIHGGVQFTINSGVIFCNMGKIIIQSSALFINNGIYSGNGPFEGDFINQGSVRPSPQCGN